MEEITNYSRPARYSYSERSLSSISQMKFHSETKQNLFQTISYAIPQLHGENLNNTIVFQHAVLISYLPLDFHPLNPEPKIPLSTQVDNSGVL